MEIKCQKKCLLVSFIILFILNPTTLFSQNKVKVHAEGTSISRDKTPKEALQEAIVNAQSNALKISGISEQVTVSSLLVSENGNDNFENYFNQVSTIESNANIVVDSVYKDTKRFDDYGNMLVTVEIDATVYKYNLKKDKAFFFNVKGLKDVYYDNEFILFSFIPTKNGFLKIFVVNEKEAFVLYPFEDTNQIYFSDNKERQFKQREEVNFPIHESYKPGYVIELDDSLNEEISVFIFVYTKSYVPFIDNKINLNTIKNWIFNIPVDQREFQFKSVLLKKL